MVSLGSGFTLDGGKKQIYVGGRTQVECFALYSVSEVPQVVLSAVRVLGTDFFYIRSFVL